MAPKHRAIFVQPPYSLKPAFPDRDIQILKNATIYIFQVG